MPLLDVFWSMLWFFMFFIWIWLLISIFGDIFRSDKSGVAKAGWIFFVIALPLLGVLIYLITNGSAMQERSVNQMVAADKAQKDYIRSVAAPTSAADEVAKLAQLKDSGAITDAEFQAAKAKLLV